MNDSNAESIFIRIKSFWNSIKAYDSIKKLIQISKWLFTPVALIFIVVTAWQSRTVILETLQNSLPVYFFIAMLANMATHFLSPLFATKILNASGAGIRYRQMLDLHISYLPARYIPGGIWHTVARVNGLYNLGVGNKQLGSFVIFENLMSLSVVFILGGISVWFYRQNTAWEPVAGLAVLLGLIMLPALPLFIKKWVLKSNELISGKDYIKALGILIIYWCLATAIFLFFLTSFPHAFHMSDWLETSGAYLFSWGIGFIAVFAPQGVGVFEVTAASLIPTSLPFPALVALFAGFRMMTLLAELLLWCIWSAFLRRMTVK